MNIIICDNDIGICKNTQTIINSEMSNLSYKLCNTYICDSPNQLPKLKILEKIDILIINIRLGNKSGIEIARSIRNIKPQIIIVFLSDNDEFDFESLRCRPLGFVCKSKLSLKLPQIIRDIYEELVEKQQVRLYKADKELVRIDLKELIYVEVYGHEMKMYMENQEVKTHYTLKKFCELYGRSGFIQCHKSYAVNYRFIYSVEKHTILLKVKQIRLPLSRHRSIYVKEQLELLTYYD